VLTRRELLKGAAGAGALLVARPFRTFASAPLEARRSRVFPANGTFVVHSDLHNHTLLSDGAGAAADAFSKMRESGLDVAAITDHAVFGEIGGTVCAGRCSEYAGINEAAWQQIKAFADAANDDGEFVAMRGFEWTTGTIGHVNVWFSERWIDAFTTLGLQSVRGAPVLAGEVLDPELQAALAPVFDELPENATMDLFYEWLRSEPDRPLLGGGNDGIAGFNHPNEFGNFNDFRFSPAVADRIVSCEALNGHRDFLFWGHEDGMPSPLNACLNAGWRVGMLGVSDEHGATRDTRKARGGLWVTGLSRRAVREALVARRFFATFEPGFRLDAAANGVQMGGAFVHQRGPVRFDLDLGTTEPAAAGRTLEVQVLRPGTDVPTVATSVPVVLGAAGARSFVVPIDLDDGDWVLLRVSDPDQPADAGTPDAFTGFGRALAYASPFWLRPA
jgi:hypothetical protein